MQAEEVERQKVEDESKKDKIILYNEIMDVMRAIMHIYRQKDNEEKTKQRKLLIMQQLKKNGKVQGDFLDQHFLGEELGEGEGQVGYFLEKQLIVQAWAKYRPESAPPTPKGGDKKGEKSEKDRSDLNQVFGHLFIEKLLKGVKQKLYKGRRDFDFAEMKRRREEMLQGIKGKQQDEDVQFLNDFATKASMVEDDPLKTKHIPEEELHLVNEFLNQFIFITEGTSGKSQVDISLVLKSLPARVDTLNVYRVDMIGFAVVQKALIAFQNDDQDELFVHYDDRSKQRLRKLNNHAGETHEQSDFLKDLSHKLLQIVNKMVKRTGTASTTRPANTNQKNEVTLNKYSARKRDTNYTGENDAFLDDLRKEEREGTNEFDEIPIQSQYALQEQAQFKAVKGGGGGGQKQQQSIQDNLNVGHLYMYLPQGLKSKDNAATLNGLLTDMGYNSTGPSKHKKQRSLQYKQSEGIDGQPAQPKSQKGKSKHFYPKDYSDFKVAGGNTSMDNNGKGGLQINGPRRQLYRAGGVNFKVDLHKERAGGSISRSPGRTKNLKHIQSQLNQLGLPYDIVQDYLNQRVNVGQNIQKSTNTFRIPNGSTNERTPRDSIYGLSDQEQIGESVNEDSRDNSQMRQTESQNTFNVGQSSIQEPQVITGFDEEEKQELKKHKAPKVQWFKNGFNPVYD